MTWVLYCVINECSDYLLFTYIEHSHLNFCLVPYLYNIGSSIFPRQFFRKCGACVLVRRFTIAKYGLKVLRFLGSKKHSLKYLRKITWDFFSSAAGCHWCKRKIMTTTGLLQLRDVYAISSYIFVSTSIQHYHCL